MNNIKWLEFEKLEDIQQEDFKFEYLRGEYYLGEKLSTQYREYNHAEFITNGSKALNNKIFKNDIFEIIDIEYNQERRYVSSNFSYNVHHNQNNVIHDAQLVLNYYDRYNRNKVEEDDRDADIVGVGKQRFKYLLKVVSNKESYGTNEVDIDEKIAYNKKIVENLHCAITEFNTKIKEKILVTSFNSVLDNASMSVSKYYTSCHNIFDGCYSSGATGFIGDEHTRVLSFYNLSSLKSYVENKSHHLYRYKIGRQLIHLNNDSFVLSRPYPANDFRAVAINEAITNLVNNKFYDSTCNINKDNRSSMFYISDDFTGYSDLRNYDFVGRSINDDIDECMIIGDTSLRLDGIFKDGGDYIGNGIYTCENCGAEYEHEDDFVYSSSAGDYACVSCAFYCDNCDTWHSRDDRYYIGGRAYCAECVEDMREYE